MDTILDMTKLFLSSACFCLLPTDVTWDNFFLLLMSDNCVGIFLGEMEPVTANMDAISL